MTGGAGETRLGRDAVVLTVRGEVMEGVSAFSLGVRAGRPQVTAITESSPGGTRRWLVAGAAVKGTRLVLDLVEQTAKEIHELA